MLTKYLLCISHVHGSVESPEDFRGQMMAFVFLTFLQSGKAVVIEGDRYYGREKCKHGGGGVLLCPGEWKNLHKSSKLELGFEEQEWHQLCSAYYVPWTVLF